MELNGWGVRQESGKILKNEDSVKKTEEKAKPARYDPIGASGSHLLPSN